MTRRVGLDKARANERMRLRMARLRAADPEKYRKYQRDRNREIRAIDPSKFRAAARARRGANLEEFRAKERAYYQANREKKREQNRAWRARNVAKKMFHSARDRASKKGLDFSITIDDIVIPDRCPVLGIPFVPASGRVRDGSATLERIENIKGYVPGNVIVISWRANRLKGDATVAELRAISAFYSGLELGGGRANYS